MENDSLIEDVTSTLYPFGSIGGDGYLCIHKINFEIYSTYQGESEPDYIAPSFEDFIDGLEDVPDEG